MTETTQPQGIPTILSKAPDFTATSTLGPIKLSDYKGKWVVLFSHPADFTPVCTTELAAFARRSDDFKKRDTQLIGISIDSIYSHLEWINQMEKMFDVKVEYPLIADLDMKVAQLYGMVHPGASETATVRAVFFIDPDQMIRAMVYYPLTSGRSLDEIVRVLDALQANTKHGVATPEGWRPGEKVIVPPPKTYADAKKREADTSLEVTHWWFSKKSI